MKRAGMLTALAMALFACGNARLVQRYPSGGVFALGGNHGVAMGKARNAMAEQCAPDGYVIIEEGEEPIGTRWSIRGIRTVTEWRVRYQCTGATEGE